MGGVRACAVGSVSGYICCVLRSGDNELSLEFVSFEVDFFPDLLALSLTHTDISDNRAICAVYIISVLTLLTVVFAFIFSKAAGRRIRNEMR